MSFGDDQTEGDTDVTIQPLGLMGFLDIPESAIGIVVFAHGSGSSRLSPRNRYVADQLRSAGIGTLLFDLLTPQEAEDRANVFDIALLADRLVRAKQWLKGVEDAKDLDIGYFGSSTGAAAALVAASGPDPDIKAVVSRGGRPDLAAGALEKVGAPTLLIVGANDFGVIELNRDAAEQLRCPWQLELVPGATHLFEEPGTLDQVVNLATEWFTAHLGKQS